MRFLRSHPIYFAALLGAVVGLGNALLLEIPALFGKPSKGVLSLLEPASQFRSGANGTGVAQTATLLFIEVAANVLVWAAIFSVFGLIFVALRRMFRSSARAASDENKAS